MQIAFHLAAAITAFTTGLDAFSTFDGVTNACGAYYNIGAACFRNFTTGFHLEPDSTSVEFSRNDIARAFRDAFAKPPKPGNFCASLDRATGYDTDKPCSPGVKYVSVELPSSAPAGDSHRAIISGWYRAANDTLLLPTAPDNVLKPAPELIWVCDVVPVPEQIDEFSDCACIQPPY